MSNASMVPPVFHLEFHYKEIDTMLAVGYAIATLMGLWALCAHMNGASSRDVATTGFYLLMSLAALVRGAWFSTPYSIHVSGYVPQRLHIFDDGWTMLFLSEVAEMLGTFFLYSIFILMVVFWADILRRAFDPHAYAESHPMRVFLSLFVFLFLYVSTGFVLFVLDRIDSLLLLMYNDIAISLLSTICAVFVGIYCCRMRTVLIAFFEVSQIETTGRIQTVTRTGVLCATFLVANACFASYMGYHMYQLLMGITAASPSNDSMSWWLFLMTKHLVEIFLLYALLFLLCGSSGPDNAESKSQSDIRRQYDPIPDAPVSPTDATHMIRRPSSQRQFLLDQSAPNAVTTTSHHLP
ncbi:hypothetical protein H310_01637 [Aphanomyces invadans]|uniref:THH1/TOM1/TOM3 domain-containing protein n=1 Tax=Aphanomyces invadans TaxID=157072 RepID=A0A024UU89_9STRA|nr:hypothetical protein H310_01637 [Aphanomyces invadans]ETW09233.1 hypothetical protein H310_01637 [Aphanomyces invadans]|eukprot:XP_008863038.1 hypothetical protein H310_01637 [Aphanomyces invadans]